MDKRLYRSLAGPVGGQFPVIVFNPDLRSEEPGAMGCVWADEFECLLEDGEEG